jgi:hypothetical protein
MRVSVCTIEVGEAEVARKEGHDLEVVVVDCEGVVNTMIVIVNTMYLEVVVVEGEGVGVHLTKERGGRGETETARTYSSV